ncbi:hypothetical protein [Agromyces sp. Leaf222]|uniref:hypothetical protein n=1 Tax=Agromyces sp. Leaf222 TaxID=1735688 RepID=UPI0012F779D5|nr:hypothetical protein [Agromyces sp. Leaf222]
MRQIVVRRSGSGDLGAALFDPARLYRDIANGVLSRLSAAGVNDVVEDTVAALEREGDFSELSESERASIPMASGWMWDHRIADEVERQLQRRDRMAVVLYALSTRGRRDRTGREGWADARQVLVWLADRYPTLPEVVLPEAPEQASQTWVHPGAPAPLPSKIVKRSRGEHARDRQRSFDYQQFKRSIRLAVVGRFDEKTRDGQVDLIAEWVMWGLAGQEVVLSSQLAAGVLDCLRRIDDIAYLRWTALVKEFDSVTEFAQEATGLLRYPSPPLALSGSIRRGREAPTPPIPH